MDYERRAVQKKPFIEGRTLVGTAAVYNCPAELPGFTEVIGERAFDGILATNPDTVCLFNHNADFPLGRASSGTLKLYADHRGLNFSVELPDTTWGNDVYKSVQRGDIAGCSFAFQTDKAHQRWEERGGKVIRTITGFTGLQDVSPVTFPVYKETSVDARSVNWQQSAGEFIQQELGVSFTDRPAHTQKELLRMASSLIEMRSKGYEVSVEVDGNWPRIVDANPQQWEVKPVSARFRRRIIFDLPL